MKKFRSIINAEFINIFRSFKMGLFVLFFACSLILIGVFYALSQNQFIIIKNFIIYILPFFIMTIISQEILIKLFYNPKQEGTIIPLIASQISPVYIWFVKVSIIFIIIYFILFFSTLLSAAIIYFTENKLFYLDNNLKENIIYFIISPFIGISFIALEGALLMIFKDLTLAKNFPRIFGIAFAIIFIRIGAINKNLLRIINSENIIIFFFIISAILFIISLLILLKKSNDNFI